MFEWMADLAPRDDAGEDSRRKAYQQQGHHAQHNKSQRHQPVVQHRLFRRFMRLMIPTGIFATVASNHNKSMQIYLKVGDFDNLQHILGDVNHVCWQGT